MKHGWIAVALSIALAGCASEAADPKVPSPVSPADRSPTPTVQDIMELEYFAPLEPGTYFIDPDADPSTPSGWCTRFPWRDGRSGSARPSSRMMGTSGWASPP